LAAISEIYPDIADDLTASIDQPLRVQTCPQTSKDYLLCDYNRDGDSYRSPWSNEYDPPIADGNLPSAKTRRLEISANEAFAIYANLYYEAGTVTSVYFWDVDDGFAGVILLKKMANGDSENSSWDSIHVFEAKERGRHASYRLTSSIMLYLDQHSMGTGKLSLAGNLTRQNEQDFPLDDFTDHVGNLGRFVEDVENRMRNSFQDLYFGKMRDVVNDLRAVNGGLQSKKVQGNMQAELFAKLAARRRASEQKE